MEGASRRVARGLAWRAALVLGVLAVAPVAPCAAEVEDVRPAAVAGGFYPSSAGELTSLVRGFLDAAGPAVPDELRDRAPLVLVAPHAGYIYSGSTAALSYKLLEGKPRPSRVILIGPSHRMEMWEACSVADYAYFETPLGRLPVDAETVKRLVERDPFHAARLPHEQEHCLEVQLPFLQVLWGDPPPIVPILVGYLSPDQCRLAATGIAEACDQNALIVVSTDFTHYGRGFAPFAGVPEDSLAERIRQLDMKGVGHMLDVAPAAFGRFLVEEDPTICGGLAIRVILEMLARSDKARPVFLRWANSSDVSHDFSYCVSYVALAVYAESESLKQMQAPVAAREAPTLTPEDRLALLDLARRSIARAVSAGGGVEEVPDPADLPEALKSECGAFVTLEKDGELRGCIGRMTADAPLWKCVCAMAVAAALQDRRFLPVRAEELEDIRIEISVLGPLQRVASPDEIQVGRDGLVVSGEGHRGLLLPQVATENGWDVEEFLRNTCRKAGLPTDAWQQEGVTIYKFTATVFGEEREE